MKKTVLLVILLGIFAVTSVSFAAYGKKNKLSGIVKEKGTLKPISGAKVKIYTSGGTLKDSDKTGRNGKYVFNDLKERKHRVMVTVPGYRNPWNVNRYTVSKTVKVSGSDWKNFYLQKI